MKAHRLGSIVALGCALSVSACAPARRPDDDASPRSVSDVTAPTVTPDPGDVAPIESLTLTQALAALDAQHPDLAALRHQVDAATTRAEAAGAFPAPAALIRAENVPLNRGSSFDQGNYIAGLAFDLPLQGRLSAARAVEERDGELVSRELEVTRHRLQRAARDAFAIALATQRAAEYHEDAAGSAERLARLLDRRVARGDLAPDEATWAAVEAARSRLEAEQSRSLARRAHARLTETIGSRRSVASVLGDLDETVGTPDLAALLRRVEQAPGVRRADAAVALREAVVELARAERIPDVRLEVAYRRLEQSDQHSVDAGLLIPFPFMGGSRQRADAARLDLEAARAHAGAARLATTREVQDAYERLATSVARAQALGELLPRVEAAMAAVAARLARGDISALEAIPARRVAISYRLEHLDALAQAVRAWADLDAALGSAP